MRLAPPDPPLGDELVRLRPPRPDDVDAITEACADWELTQWLPRVPWPYAREHAEAFVASGGQAWGDGKHVALALADPESDALVGVLGLEPVGRRAGLELGYWLAPAARGRGLMTRAIDLVCRWAFAGGWPRMEAFVRPDNHASRAVLARAGFREEGVLRRAMEDRGTLRDVVILSRLADD